jgi:hypothetical protein
MRFSGLVRWMRTALAGATVSFALPFAVMAQQADAPQRWEVNGTPQTSADGRVTFCSLWYGRSPQPRVSIWLGPDRRQLNLVATEFGGGSGDQVQAELQFPSGLTGTVVATHGDGGIGIGLTGRLLEEVLNELRHSGELVITANGHSFSFPVGNISGAVDAVQDCHRQLLAS